MRPVTTEDVIEGMGGAFLFLILSPLLIVMGVGYGIGWVLKSAINLCIRIAPTAGDKHE